jgi:hypothetical protein
VLAAAASDAGGDGAAGGSGGASPRGDTEVVPLSEEGVPVTVAPLGLQVYTLTLSFDKPMQQQRVSSSDHPAVRWLAQCRCHLTHSVQRFLTAANSF